MKEGRTGAPVRSGSHQCQSQRSSTRRLAPHMSDSTSRTRACGKGDWTHDAFFRLARDGFHGRHVDLSYAMFGTGGNDGEKKGFRQIFVSRFVPRPTTIIDPDESAIWHNLGLIRPEGASQTLARDRRSTRRVYRPHTTCENDPGP